MLVTEVKRIPVNDSDQYVYEHVYVSESCIIPGLMEEVIHECNAPYEISLEQTGNYGPGWKSAINGTRYSILLLSHRRSPYKRSFMLSSTQEINIYS